MMTIQNEELASTKREERMILSSNILICEREENKEQSDDALFLNNMIQQVCGNARPKLILHIEQFEDNKN